MATSGSWTKEWASNTWGGYPKGYRWKGNWTKSGNTITLSNQTLQIYMISGTGWGTASDTVSTTGGSAQSVSFTMSGSESNIASLANSSFSVTNNQTSATISCYIDGEVTGDVGITFDATIVAPTTPTVSITSRTPTDLGITYGTSSFGNPSTGTVSLYGGTSANPTTQLTSKTSTGNSTYYWNGLTANTAYHVRARASNAQTSSNYSADTLAVTLAETPTVSLESTDGESATFSYATEADGGYYAKTIEYSLDGGSTWNTALTITTGDATNGTFTVEGLTSGETYEIKVRTTTSAGSSSAETISFTAGAVSGVGPNGRMITGALGSVNGIATRITRILSYKETA